MTRFQISWEIAKRSWAVLKSDKSLAWFPVLSFLASIAVFGVFAGLVAAIGLDGGATKDSRSRTRVCTDSCRGRPCRRR